MVSNPLSVLLQVEEVVRYACVQVDMPSSALAVDVMDRGSGRDGKARRGGTGPESSSAALGKEQWGL